MVTVEHIASPDTAVYCVLHIVLCPHHTMSSRVQALNVTHVRPDQGTGPPPHHGSGHAIELSPFDTLVIALTPMRRLFFYQGDHLPPFASLIRSLRSSLAATLAVFTPLAGKLAVSSSGDVFIDCSPDAVSQGVRFVEAEYAGGADDMRRLAGDAEHDAEAFLQLAPELPVSALPAPVLAVQVTRPAGADDSAGGGVLAVGVSVSHTVADGQALWQFLRAWAAAVREGSPARPGLTPPTFSREAINRHPRAEEMARMFVRIFAPALPTVNTFPEPDITRQRRRTYLVGASQIQSLKRRISLQSNGARNQPAVVEVKPPTAYAAVAALVWTSFVRAKSFPNHGDDAYLMFAADCRARLRPPVGDAFFGNCVKSCYARATVGELLGGGGDDDGALARAAAAVREAVREYTEEPVADVERWLERHAALPRERVVQIGASHRFPAYETDFGWGAPSRVELASVFVKEFVALVGAPNGGVQVSVALDREHMDGFEVNFLSQLQGSVST
ncbi:hypothetical protein ACP70R_042263 [Stipagrostis hirtigluma subsp. patula]